MTDNNEQTLTRDLAELQEAWRTTVGDGTDKITPSGIKSLMEDHRHELAEARTQLEAERQKNARLSAPVNDEEWRGYASGFDHWRSTFDDMITSRASDPPKEVPSE